MTESLGPDQRIRKKSTFQALFKKGRFLKGTFLRIWVCSNPDNLKDPAAKPQLGVIVSRKTDTRAVKRNLWKRRIREAFRKNQAKIKSNTAVLVQAAKGLEKAPSYQTIQTELFDLLAKAECLK